MSRHSSLIDAAMARARDKVASDDASKTASATSGSLAEQARESARALEFISIKIADDGTPEGEHRVSVIQDFLANKEAAKGPAQSVSPTGTQAHAPQAGKRTITPSASANGRPTEHEAPTGTQTTIGQDPPASQKPPTEGMGKKASLMDLVLGHDRGTEKEAAKGGPADSVALDNQARPPAKNENTNIAMLRSNEGPVSATKKKAKSPTRARLKSLFAGASDTGPSQAAAKAAFPKAYAGAGGIKEAMDNEDQDKGDDKKPMSLVERLKGKKDGGDKESKKEASLSEWGEVFGALLDGRGGPNAQKMAQAVDALEV